MMQTADRIAKELGGDGRDFPEGMEEMLRGHGDLLCVVEENGREVYPHRYVFNDSSCIVVTDNAWDVGLSEDCNCFGSNRDHESACIERSSHWARDKALSNEYWDDPSPCDVPENISFDIAIEVYRKYATKIARIEGGEGGTIKIEKPMDMDDALEWAIEWTHEGDWDNAQINADETGRSVTADVRVFIPGDDESLRQADVVVARPSDDQ